MDEQIVESLLGKTAEDRTVDFKAETYRLGNDPLRARFVKDILSLANTPRTGSAFILLGVKAHPDGHKDVLGVSEHPDDADLQQLIGSKVEPIPHKSSPLETRQLAGGRKAGRAVRRGQGACGKAVVCRITAA